MPCCAAVVQSATRVTAGRLLHSVRSTALAYCFLFTVAMASTRSKTEVYLLGSLEHSITGTKLPSKKQVLQVFLNHHLQQRKTKNDAAVDTMAVVEEFWNRARIPMQKPQRARENIIRLYEKWVALKKNKNRATATQKANERKFVDSLENLFDIAHANAMSMITLEEDREFLKAQREEGRRGSMISRDMSLAKQESRRKKRKVEEQRRVTKALQEQEKVDETAELSSSSSSTCSPKRPFDEGAGPSASQMPPSKRPRSSKKVLDSHLSAALDRTLTSDRDAVHLISAAARSLGHDPNQLVINRESFRRDRRKFRAVAAAEIKKSFKPSVPLTVHWDGKIIPTADGGPAVDRLPVLVSGDGVEKLLAVPSLPNGTGQAAAHAIITTLEDWGVENRVVALSFDTTASNTGLAAGACSIVEQRLGCDVLHLACRHHIYELICEKAFFTCFGPSSSPEIQLFKRFKGKWEYLNRTTPKAMEMDKMSQNLRERRDDLLVEFQRLLDGQHPRDDYRELLELSIIVLGGQPKRGIRITRPGALHRARWMAKIIYAVKVFLFRDQDKFQLTQAELSRIKRFVEFSVSTYVAPWYKAPCPTSAPAQDLALLKSLLAYPDTDVAKATSATLGRHLWYLSERLVALAFFDDNVSLATKRDMVKASKEQEGSEDPPRRATVDTREATFTNKTIADFVTTGSMKLLQLMSIDMTFLASDPAAWNKDPAYLDAQRRIRALRVVNDFAERGVAMMQTYNLALTKDEGQKQYLLQVVEAHRRSFPTVSRSCETQTRRQ